MYIRLRHQSTHHNYPFSKQSLSYQKGGLGSASGIFQNVHFQNFKISKISKNKPNWICVSTTPIFCPRIHKSLLLQNKDVLLGAEARKPRTGGFPHLQFQCTITIRKLTPFKAFYKAILFTVWEKPGLTHIALCRSTWHS